MIIGAVRRRNQAPCRTRIRWLSTGRRSSRSVNRISFLCYCYDFPLTLQKIKRWDLHSLDRNTLPFTMIGLYVHFLNRWPLLRAHTQDSTSGFPQVIPRLHAHLHTSHQYSCTTCGIWFLLFLSNRVSDPLLYFTHSHPISYSIPPSKCTSELQKKAHPQDAHSTCATHPFP
jgi:hypothetical protein